MQSISPEIIFRGKDAWSQALPQIPNITKKPLILGRSINTQNLRNKILEMFFYNQAEPIKIWNKKISKIFYENK